MTELDAARADEPTTEVAEVAPGSDAAAAEPLEAIEPAAIEPAPVEPAGDPAPVDAPAPAEAPPDDAAAEPAPGDDAADVREPADVESLVEGAAPPPDLEPIVEAGPRTVGRFIADALRVGRRALRLHGPGRIVPRAPRRLRGCRDPGRRDAPRGRRRVHGRGARAAHRPAGRLSRHARGRRCEPGDRHPHRPPGFDADVRDRRPGRACRSRPRGVPGDRPGGDPRWPRQVGGRARVGRRDPVGDGRGDPPGPRRPAGSGPPVARRRTCSTSRSPTTPAWTPFDPSVARATDEELRSVIEFLASARRPVILAGGGVLRARTSTELTRFAELLQVPVIAAWRRADVISNDHAAVPRDGRVRGRVIGP